MEPVVSRALNFWIFDYGADLFERLCAGVLNANVRVGEHFHEFRHDVGQTGGELLGRAVGHRAEKFHAS